MRTNEAGVVTVTVTRENPNYYHAVDNREDFDEDRNIEVEEPARYLTVYEVTRHYGGPQEGGWWYNWHARVVSIPFIEPGSKAEAEQIEAFLKPRFVDEGDIYSVRGGVLFEFVPEYEPGENETRQRPHYE